MRKYFKFILSAVIISAFAACTPASIDELSGIFAAPADLALETLSGVTIDKQEGFRFITLDLGGRDNATIKFATKDYYLSSNTYYLNPAQGIKAGMYEEGASTINGKAITFGTVTVESSPAGGDDYDCLITGVVETGDNNRQRINWSGKLNFPPDPEPEILKKVLSAQSNVASGTMSVTINLATEGVSTSFDPTTYSTVYSGSGYYAALDIYSADGYLHEGTYKASKSGGDIQEGEFAIGWDPGDLWGIGMVFSNWGSCWWTVDNGVTTAEKINNGEIVVSRKGGNWVIEYNNYDVNKIWFKFTGAIDALTAPGGQVQIDWYKMIMNKGDANSVTDENNNPVTGFDRWDVQLLNGDAVVAAFDLVVNAGDDIAGDYVVKGYPHEDHVAGNGWGIPDWNYFGGSRVAAGGAWLYIAPGSTICVTKTGDGSYTFTSGDIQFENSATGEKTEGTIALGGNL